MESSLKEFAQIIGIDDFSELSKRLKEFLEEVSMPRANGTRRFAKETKLSRPQGGKIIQQRAY